jgi:hypothetical protein
VTRGADERVDVTEINEAFASGVTEVLYELQRTVGRYGLITMCCGFGLGTGNLLERA